MSNCGDTNPCAPVNPCDCAETAAIREQGPPGARGLPGGIPVFTIGTVTSGAVPSVTIVQVNPLLYQINFVIPTVKLNTDNFWTGVQTFEQTAIFQAGLHAAGASTFDQLTASGAFTAEGTALFLGVATFSGPVVLNSDATVAGTVNTLNLHVRGEARFDATALAPNTCYIGYCVLDSCGRLHYVNAFSPNSAAGGTGLAQVVTFAQSETAIGFNLPFVVPNVPDCGSAMSVTSTIFGRVSTNAGGALPPDISAFRVTVRLDNAVTGTVLATASFTNFEFAGQWYVNAQIPPGSHTLFFTVQGLGVGSSSITLSEVTCAIQF